MTEIYGTNLTTLPADDQDLPGFIRAAAFEAKALDACAGYEFERGNDAEGLRLEESAVAVTRLMMAAKARHDRNRW